MCKIIKKFNSIIPAVLIFFIFSFSSFPSSHIQFKNFGKITILENGRLKPLDTFARNILKELSAKSKLKKIPASLWLARVLFNSPLTVDDKIFLVNNDEVLNSIGLYVTRGRDRYSFKELSRYIRKLRSLAFAASKIKQRSQVEQEIIDLYNKIYIYNGLADSFTFFRPDKNLELNDDELKKELSLPSGKNIFSFYDLAVRSEQLKKLLSKYEDKKDEKKIETVHKLIHYMEESCRYNSSLPLTIIPGNDSNSGKWVTPWDIAINIFNSEIKESEPLNILKDIYFSYKKNNIAKFESDISKFNKNILSLFKGKNIEQKINTEVLYNKIDPFYKSEFFYGFSIFFILISFLSFKKINYRIGFFLLIIGIIPHSYGIIARMIIMNRPPVTNLYETFIFASWITVILGLILEFSGKKNIGLLTGSISGLILLIISGRYALEGDTMGMLVAVLDSNFWLATHVITITIGYGGIVISGTLGHLYIFQKLFLKKDKEKKLKDTFQSVYSTQAFGLIFTFIGTVLGGIWADQSWGRFWGWDPKENGALLIVICSAILFHAKLGKMIKETGFSIGAIAGIINVVLAWFGVNLLGVGLHSYGFSSNVAFSLFAYVILELGIIIFSIIWFGMKKGTMQQDSLPESQKK